MFPFGTLRLPSRREARLLRPTPLINVVHIGDVTLQTRRSRALSSPTRRSGRPVHLTTRLLRTPPASAVEETEMHEIHRVGTGMHRISLIE